MGFPFFTVSHNYFTLAKLKYALQPFQDEKKQEGTAPALRQSDNSLFFSYPITDSIFLNYSSPNSLFKEVAIRSCT